MKPTTIPVVIEQPATTSKPAFTEVQSVPIPAVAMPIPMKKKPTSLPASGDNSFVEQNRDVDLTKRFDKMDLKEEDENEDDEETEQSTFGIAWIASDDFDDEGERPHGCIFL